MVTRNAADEATGASGTVLQGQGVGTASAFSTATYPSTAGTSLNLLESDGTNFVSTAPIILKASGNISSANFKLINTTPVTMVAAPASGKSVYVIGMSIKLNYGGTNPFTAGGGLSAYFTNASGQSICAVGSISYTSSASTVSSCVTTLYQGISTATTTAVPVVLSSPSNPGGNAAGDNTVDWFIVYYIDF